jgi:hypothetical protein
MTNWTGGASEYTEGSVARTIEHETSKLPSDAFLWIAVACMGTSAALQAARKPHISNFIGQWAPTLLILGLYNKLVKVLGSDRRMAA